MSVIPPEVSEKKVIPPGGRIRRFKPATSAEGDFTVLDSVVAGLGWAREYGLGKGLDAVTGALSGVAVKPFSVTNPSTPKTGETVRMITNQSDFSQEVEVSASGKYNMEGVNITASTSFLQKIQYSLTSITLMARFESINTAYSEAKTPPELTDEAKKILAQDPKKFQTLYGDYFIAGSLNGSRFLGIYVCTSTSESSMNEFKASIGTDVPNVFSVEGTTRFMQAVKKSNINLDVSIDMLGQKGVSPIKGPWTPDKILEALGWFKDNLEGVPLNMLLNHYSTIDPSFPRTVPISPDVFVELSKLYQSVWNVRALYQSVPSVYQNEYKDAFHNVNVGIPANQNALAVDATKRTKYQDDADVLWQNLTNVLTRRSFYENVQLRIKTEPAKNQEIAGGYIHSFLYGFKSYHDPAVVIGSFTQSYKEDWHVGWRQKTLEWSPGDKYLMVGWEVINNWADDTNGVWWKDTDQILLTSYSAVHVKSYYDRGCNWSVTTYWVPKKDYLFGTSEKSELDSELDSKRLLSKREFTWTKEKTLQEAVYQSVEDMDQIVVSGLDASDWNKVFKTTKFKDTKVEGVMGGDTIAEVIKAAAPLLEKLSPLAVAFVSIFAIAAYKGYSLEYKKSEKEYTFYLGPQQR